MQHEHIKEYTYYNHFTISLTPIIKLGFHLEGVKPVFFF